MSTLKLSYDPHWGWWADYSDTPDARDMLRVCGRTVIPAAAAVNMPADVVSARYRDLYPEYAVVVVQGVAR